MDGPLNPFKASWFGTPNPPLGFRFFDLEPSDGITYRVALSQDHGRELVGLSDAFDLVCASTWREDTNLLISPILGLPQDLPVIPLLRPRGHDKPRSWKVEQIADWVRSSLCGFLPSGG